MSLQLSLETQMRAGTHFMCLALRHALEATLMRPRDGIFQPMSDESLLMEMHGGDFPALSQSRPDRTIFFTHYFHPQRHALKDMKRICLIGFPHDSFYSDGIVYSSDGKGGPSGGRDHAERYVFRHGSPEWKYLEDRMAQNAAWLGEITEDENTLVVRYEDLGANFAETAARIEAFTVPFLHPLPAPLINRKRSYWSRDYSGFDERAMVELEQLFGKAIARFYPEVGLPAVA